MSLYEQVLHLLATNRLALRIIDQRTKERDEWREAAEKAGALALEQAKTKVAA